MRRFFLAYQDRAGIAQFQTGQLAPPPGSGAIAQSGTGRLLAPPPATQPFRLSWTHYVFLLGIQNPEERSFYEIEAASQGWNLRELKRQFDTSLYERLALSRDQKGVRKLAKEGQVIAQPADLLKEPLVLECLGLEA